MKALVSFRILIHAVFMLLMTPIFGMNLTEETIQTASQKYFYKKIICQLKGKPEPKDAKTFFLKNEKLLFYKFTGQLIANYSQKKKDDYTGYNDFSEKDFEKVIGKEFDTMKTKYKKGSLLLAWAIDDSMQLQGAMFFYPKENNSVVVIRSLMIDNIYNPDLFQKIYNGMVQVILKQFPYARIITIFERTIPDIWKPTLQEYGFKSTVIQEWTEYNQIMNIPAYQYQLTWSQRWLPCNLL